MNFVVDPVWPWSHVWAFLSTASPSVLAAALLAGGLAFALPVLMYLRPWGLSPRALLRGSGLLLAALLGWVLLHTRAVTGGPAGRLQGMGLAVLLAVPLALAGLTVWTYLTTTGATRRRVGTVLTLRLGAFALALFAVLRPSLAFPDRNQTHSQLLIALDASESMTIRDESGSRSRWEVALRTLRECEPQLERLRDAHKIDVSFFRFAADTAEFRPDEPGGADGKRTDMGELLRRLYEARDGRRPLRGLVVIGDGAHNGTTRPPPLAEAGRWRNLPCPVQTFACGSPNTSDRQSDVALTAIATEPTPVPIKGKLTTRVTIDAPGFENRTVRLRLFLDGKEVTARNETLRLTAGNEVKVECTAPPKPGEVKVTVRVEDPQHEGKPLPGDVVAANNEITTFATVSKEGVSVLLVDRSRYEAVKIYDALARDPRIRVEPVFMRGGGPADDSGADLFKFDEKQYDVIIFGDVTARQVRAVNPNALETIEKMVEKGAGFLMIGGYSSFGNGDWKGTPVEKLLPVELSPQEPVERPVKMVPTEAGLRKFGYVLRLAEVKDQKAAWAELPELEGMSRLGRSRSGLTTVLAATKDGEPLLVAQNFGSGRTMAFAGDTTEIWARRPKTLPLHTRFWRQMVMWLAKQEDAEGSVWVKPDTRRLPVRGELSFRVGVRSKGGVDLKNATYRAEVVGPNDVRVPVAIAHGENDDLGLFTRTDVPGEYRIEVHGEAKDSGGEAVSGEASARFMVYDEDVEMARRAADHDFLRKLAEAGGGRFHRVEDLPQYLQSLEAEPAGRGRTRVELVPNWRTTARSPFFVGLLGAFVALLAAEWVLRRRWGMV